MDEQHITRVKIIGTQALREAKNAAAFLAPAEAILGAPIEVIAGKREADLAFTAVARTFTELAGTPGGRSGTASGCSFSTREIALETAVRSFLRIRSMNEESIAIAYRFLRR